MKENVQIIKIAPTFFIIKNVVEIKNVKRRKKRDINNNVKNVFTSLLLTDCHSVAHSVKAAKHAGGAQHQCRSLFAINIVCE